MLSNAQAIVLSRSQEACLSALRLGKCSLGRIAMTTALSIKKTNRALSALESLGLAERDRSPITEWRVTPRGKTCAFVLDGQERPQEDSRRAIRDRPTIARFAGSTDRGTNCRENTWALSPGRSACSAQASSPGPCEVCGSREPILVGVARR